ncbi:general negative regulator of transcription subfamily 2 [Nucleospora cyclopteri]
MKELSDQLKSVMYSEEKPIERLENLEDIAERTIKPNYFIDIKADALLNRMLPKCYTDFVFTNVNVQALNDETLFYIFYGTNNCELQIRAYNEILEKGYYYSKTLEQFVLLSDIKIADNKKRTILVFNPFKWERENIDVFFDDNFIKSLEEKKIPVEK